MVGHELTKTMFHHSESSTVHKDKKLWLTKQIEMKESWICVKDVRKDRHPHNWNGIGDGKILSLRGISESTLNYDGQDADSDNISSARKNRVRNEC